MVDVLVVFSLDLFYHAFEVIRDFSHTFRIRTEDLGARVNTSLIDISNTMLHISLPSAHVEGSYIIKMTVLNFVRCLLANRILRSLLDHSKAVYELFEPVFRFLHHDSLSCGVEETSSV